MESKAHFYAPRFEAGAGAQQDTDAGAAEAAAPLHLPLAEVQRGLWFVQQLARESAAHNLVFAARVTSTVDIAAIDAALHALIGRHAALRTRYIIDDTGSPRQEVLPQVQADFAVIASAECDEQTLHARVLAETRRPFDLASAPLLRVRLYHRGGDSAVLVWTAHHIAADFWSLAVLLSEFRELYAALAAGRVVALVPVVADYPDYVREQYEARAGLAAERAWEYWRVHLGGELPLLNLASDYPRPPEQRYRGESLGFRLDAQLTAALHGLARAEGVTLYVLMLAAYYALLHRYTGQDDILVGSPVAGRTGRAYRRTVGHFVNTVVLRGAVTGDMRFVDLLHRTHDLVADAMRHQTFPFATLVERLVPGRDLSRPPLLQAGFSWERLPQFKELAAFFALEIPVSASVDFGGLRLAPYPLPQQEGQVDIALEMGGEVDGRLFGVWKYNSDLYATETVASFADHYREILHGIVSAPAEIVARLPLLTAAERERVVHAWNDTARALPPARTVHMLFEQQAARTPGRLAVSGGGQLYSYGMLNQRANQLAHYLIERGVGAGQIIGIAGMRNADMVAAMLAVMKTGAAYVPLDPGFPAERLRMMVEDAAVSCVLTQEAVWPELNLPGVQAIHLDRDWPAIAACAAHDPRIAVDEEAPAYVIYTSGSTGRPKGVVVPQRAVVNFLSSMARAPGMTADDVMLAVTTLSFDIAVLELLLPLTVGASTVIASRETSSDARALQALLIESGATLMQATPATWRMLLSDGWEGSPSLIALCGGEALSRELVDALLPRVRALWNMYGPTETTVWSTVARVEACDAISIGRPIDNTQVYILDEAMQPVPPGIAGELCIAGAGVALGYLHREDLTAVKFIANPFVPGARMYRTGDLARWRRDGRLECLGRLDHQVKLRGFRIELGEIEAALAAHSAIKQAVVTVRADAAQDPRLVAYVVAQEPLSFVEIKSFLVTRLPMYMLPSHLVQLDALPLTPNGKVDRRALPAPADVAQAHRDEFVPPRDHVEIQLAALWEQVLNVHPVGVTQGFFDLGGHSLLAVQLIAGIRARFGVELPVSTLFQHDTVEALARLVRVRDGAAEIDTPLVALRATGKKSPLFLMHPIGGTVFCYLALARHLDARRPVYALQSPGLDDAAEAEVTVPDLARRYLRLIRERQPRGPYHLGGWCFGGVIAYEAARQLQAAGETVAELVLFDSRAPIPDNAPADADDATLLSWFARDLAVPYGKTLHIPSEELRTVAGADMFAHVLQRARDVEVLPADADSARLYRYFEVYLANGIALQTYGAGDYEGPLTLFRASGEPVDYGPLLGWDRVVSRAIDVVAVPGDHNSMMYEPHVQMLAQRIDEATTACRVMRKLAAL